MWLYYKNLFRRKKIKLTTRGLDLARVEKGEVIPYSAAPKSNFLFLSRTAIEILSTNLETELIARKTQAN